MKEIIEVIEGVEDENAGEKWDGGGCLMVIVLFCLCFHETHD